MFKCLNNLAPKYLTCKFKYVQSNTRSANDKNLIIPFPQTEMFKRSFQYSGPLIWNSLPAHIKSSTSLITFKSNLKSYIMSYV